MQLQYTPFVRQLKQMYVEQVGEIVKPWALQVRQREEEGVEEGGGGLRYLSKLLFVLVTIVIRWKLRREVAGWMEKWLLLWGDVS